MFIALSTLCAACARSAPTFQILNTQTQTSEPATIQTQTEIPTPPTVTQPSSLVFPYITADAGIFALLAGETVTFTWENAPTIYSGDFPPVGVCSLFARYQPVEVYRLPDRTDEMFALLHPAVYARVLEIAPNGRYRIDASGADFIYSAVPPYVMDHDSMNIWLRCKHGFAQVNFCSTLNKADTSSRP